MFNLRSKSTKTMTVSREELKRLIREACLNRNDGEQPISILEAGCGQKWAIDLKDIPYELTGVDLDEEALRIRKEVTGDLDIAIHGDLHSIELPAAAYDVIYSSFVLEHVQDARQVLGNFVRWLKPGGRLVVTVPDRDSVHGFITNLTPHWLHVAYYRYARGKKDAGKPGHAPYPTNYSYWITLDGFREFCDRSGLRVSSVAGFNSYRPWERIIAQLVHFLSFGRLSADHRCLLLIAERVAEPALHPRESSQ